MQTETKYFGIGYPKTGTTSLARCFGLLGYKDKKIYSYFLKWWQGHDDLCDIVHDSEFLDAVDQNDMFSDWPFFHLYRELDEKFPGSKFILTVRQSEEVWRDSEDRWIERRKKELGETKFEEHMRKIQGLPSYRYQEHIDEVKAYFKDRPDDFMTLCFESGDGWEKLCPFLGVPVPDAPLPFLNRRSDPLRTRSRRPARKPFKAIRKLLRR